MTLDRSKAPAIHSIDHLEIAPLKEETLDNGIKLKILDRGHDEVNRLVALRAGGLAEAPNRGIAIPASRTLCDGTASMDGERIADEIEFNGSWIGATCHPHHLSLSMTSLNSRFDKVAPIMSEIWAAPVFPAQTFEVRRAMMVKQAEEKLLKVADMAERHASKLIMGAHNPLARYITPDSIADISLQQVKDFYNASAAGAPTTLYLTGKVTPKIINHINDTFGRLPYGFSQYDTRSGLRLTPFESNFGHGLEPSPIGPTERVYVKDALQSAVYMVLPAVKRDHPDFIPLKLAVTALGGYFGSRLMSNIREDKGYTYGITANLLGYLDGSYIQVGSECDNRYVMPLAEEVVGELRSMSGRKADKEELMRVRQCITSSLLAIIDTPFSSLDYYLNIELSGTPHDYFYRLLEASRTISADVIAEMAEKYLDPAKLQTVIAGPTLN